MTTSYLQVGADADNGCFTPTVWNQGGKVIPINSGQSYFRFPNSPIPPQASVYGAYLVFKPAQSGLGAGASSIIKGESPPGRPAITGLADANGRFATDSQATWLHDDWELTGDTYTTPNLTGIITELVNDPLYATGQALQFFISPVAHSSILYAVGFASGANPPALILDWSLGGQGRNLPWGWVSPSSAVSVGGNHDLNPFDWEPDAGSLRAGLLPVTVDDGIFATAPFTPIGASYNSAKLLATNFPLGNIPSSSKIHGIEVRMQKNRGDTWLAGDFVMLASAYDTEVVLHTAASGYMRENKAVSEANWKNTVQAPHDFTTYGGPYDSWGEVLAVDDVRNPDFGVAITASGTVQARIDQIQMRVWHTPVYSVNSGVPLYIQGSNVGTSGLTLYCKGLQPMQSGFTLFTKGPIPAFSGTPLFLQCQIETGNPTLYVGGPIPRSGNPSLVIGGYAPITSGVSLYIAGPTTMMSGTPLYIRGQFDAQVPFNLFIQTMTGTPIQSGFPLSIYGNPSGVSAFSEGKSLFVAAKDFPAPLNLYILADSFIPIQNRINLFTKGENVNISQSTPLFIGSSGFNISTPLFIQGDGIGIFGPGGFGGMPDTGVFNLFIRRGAGDAASLFIMNSAETGSVPLFVNGTNFVESGTSLFCPGAIQPISQRQQLYTHGF